MQGWAGAVDMVYDVLNSGAEQIHRGIAKRFPDLRYAYCLRFSQILLVNSVLWRG